LRTAGSRPSLRRLCPCKLSKRHGLTNAVNYLRRGETLVVTKVDRLGWSIPNLIDRAAELSDRGVAVRVLDQGIDTSTSGDNKVKGS
jgi:DNA invertase Pin-like site-specific DNA recombinase